MKDIQTDISRTPQTDFKPVKIMAVNLESKTIKRFPSVQKATEFFEIKNSKKLCRILKGDDLFTHEGVKYRFEYLKH